VEKRYLTVGVVEHALSDYEARFGMTTAEFYECHLADARRIDAIPRRHRHLWASLHRTLERMTGGGSLAGRIDRELEPA